MWPGPCHWTLGHTALPGLPYPVLALNQAEATLILSPGGEGRGEPRPVGPPLGTRNQAERRRPLRPDPEGPGASHLPSPLRGRREAGPRR